MSIKVNDWMIEENGNGTINIVGYRGNEQEIIVPNIINDKKVILVDFEAFGYWEPRITDEQKAHRATITKITFMEGIEKLGDGLFDGCKDLIEINIPDSVNEIYEKCFNNCGEKAIIKLNNSNTNYVIEDNILYNINKSNLLYCFDKSINKINIPETVTNIGVSAFSNCRELVEVYMGDSVNKIGDSAFSNCIKLNNIKISNSLDTLNFGVFLECENLKSITLPESVININKDAFFRSGIKYIIAKGIILKKSNPHFLAEVYGFAKAMLQNENMNEEIIKQNRKVINSNRKDLYRFSLVRADILKYMMKEKMIKKDEIEIITDLFNQNPNIDSDIVNEFKAYTNAL